MRLSDTYRAEASDLLAALEIALLELETQPESQDVIGQVFRNLHTIKGSGAMAGLERIAAFTHEVESVYDLVREGKIKVTPRLISLTLAARDHIKSLLDDDPTPELQRVEDRIIAGFVDFQRDAGASKSKSSQLPDPESDNSGGECTYRIHFVPPAKVFARAINLRRLLHGLHSLGKCSVSCHTQNLPDLDQFESDVCYLFWDFVLTTDKGEPAIHEVFEFVEDDSELKIVVLGRTDQDLDRRHLGEILVESKAIAPDQVHAALAEQEHVLAVQQSASKTEAPSIRVSAEKLDDLVNIVGEIVTMQARLTQVAGTCGDPEVAFVAEEMERLADKLRDRTLSIRMLPIAATFGRYRRLVRDLARELGKEVELVTRGGETELDKTVIDRIGDPLVHLIRNCVDHGVESPAERERAGKPKTGKIVLSASHSGAHVVIEIADDGVGLDKQAIRAKAIERGLIKAADDLSDNDLYELILKPGLSTAKTVSGVSGRGVGMDVVKQNVEELRGTLEIRSKAGSGTTIALRLPLTLAIIDGLLVRVGRQFFVLPLSNILECFELSAEAMRINQGRKFVVVRDEMVPFLEIRQHFGIPGERPAISQVMIAETREGKFGFLVDLVIGDHKTVIKRLGGLYKNVDSVSGAAILGDGTIALILDLNRLALEAIVSAGKLVGVA